MQLSKINGFIISLMVHLILLIVVFFHFPFQSKKIGTSPIIQIHLINEGDLSRQWMKSKFQPEKKRVDTYRKKNSNAATSFHKKQSLPSSIKQGRLDKLMILLHNHIRQYQSYPVAALLLKQQGNVEVGFTLNLDGSIDNATPLHSSGHKSLDQAALQAVLKISPVLEAKKYLHHKKLLEIWIHFKSRQ